MSAWPTRSNALPARWLAAALSLIALVACAPPRPAAEPAPLQPSTPSQEPPQRAFYAWQVDFPASAETIAALRRNHVQRIYLRFFDVDNDDEDRAVPIAPVEIASPLPPEFAYVPVVFLREHVLRHPGPGGTDALAHLRAFRYRPMVFVNMRFAGRGLLADVVTWVPGNEFPFFRVTEAPQSMPWLAPEGKTLITVDIGAQVGDALWTMDDESLGRLCLAHLERLMPGVASRYLGCNVLKTPIAYPVFLNAYEDDRLAFEDSTGIDGLLSIGRNGEFAHILMEDVYWRTASKMHDLARDLRGAHPLAA